MQISVEKPSNLGRRLVVTIAANEVDPEVDARITKNAKSIRMDGFRPGKAPQHVIKKRFGPAVRQEVVAEIIEKKLFEALAKESLNPAGMPSVDFVTNENDKDLVFSADFEIFPEIEIKDLDKIKVEKPVASIGDADIEETITKLQQQRVSWVDVNRAAAKDDQVIIDFVGRIDGEVFEGGGAEDFKLTLGSGNMIDGFEAGIEGAKADEELSIDVTFPKDYQNKELAGKQAEFTITLKKVMAPELPELNDEFAKELGVDDIAGLRAEVTNNMQREFEGALKAIIKKQVLDGLLANNEIELPQAAIKAEGEHLKKQFIERMKQMNLGAKSFDPPDDMFTEEAKKRVAVGLLLARIIEQYKLKLDADKVKTMIEQMASLYEDSESVIRHFSQDKEQMRHVEQATLEDQAIDQILSLADNSDKPMKFSEVMAESKQNQEVAS